MKFWRQQVTSVPATWKPINSADYTDRKASIDPMVQLVSGKARPVVLAETQQMIGSETSAARILRPTQVFVLSYFQAPPECSPHNR